MSIGVGTKIKAWFSKDRSALSWAVISLVACCVFAAVISPYIPHYLPESSLLGNTKAGVFFNKRLADITVGDFLFFLAIALVSFKMRDS
jgi:hypothetical protein